MSSLEPCVAVKNLLYSNWTASNPSKDSIETTENPDKVWFGNRMFAYSPPRIHSYQITVREGQARYRPLQLGGMDKYEIQDPIMIHIWVLPGVALDIETAHIRMKAMLGEIRRILNSLGDTAGSGIQQITINSKRDASRLERNPPQLYYQIDATAVLYEGIS